MMCVTKALLWNTTAEPNLSGSKLKKNKASIQENYNQIIF